MQRRYLTENEQRLLLAALKASSCPLAQRDHHWLAALILTGMRVQEFSRLTAEQVRQALGTGWLVSAKEACKGKRRANSYCVTQRLRTHLAALLALSDEQRRGHDAGDSAPQPLVWGRDIAGKAGPLSVRSYQARLTHWAGVAGLDTRISPHWLRHTRGMNIMRRSRGDNPLKVAQIALNHASLSSTGVYLQMSREEFERELQLVDGGRMRKAAAKRLAEGQGVAA